MDAVHNRSLFKNKSRDARKKLAKMGGIMASSPQLLQAGGMVPSPTSMGYNMGGNITSPETYPTNYFPGGSVAKIISNAVKSVAPLSKKALQGGKNVGLKATNLARANPKTAIGIGAGASTLGGGAYSLLSSDKEEEVANIESKMALNDLVADVQATLAAGDTISADVAQQLIEQLMPGANEKDKKELLKTTGTDTSGLKDLDEINKRIMDVAVAGTIGKSPEALNQAVLAGLQNYQATALARATSASKGGKSGMSPLEPFPDAVRDLAGKLLTSGAAGTAEEAMRQAQETLAPLYQGQTAPASPGTKPTLDEFLKQAGPQNPDTSVEDLTKYYNNTYGE
jgi:hypothetical protein